MNIKTLFLILGFSASSLNFTFAKDEKTDNITRILLRDNGKIYLGLDCARLGLDRKSLYRKMNKLGIS